MNITKEEMLSLMAALEVVKSIDEDNTPDLEPVFKTLFIINEAFKAVDEPKVLSNVLLLYSTIKFP